MLGDNTGFHFDTVNDEILLQIIGTLSKKKVDAGDSLPAKFLMAYIDVIPCLHYIYNNSLLQSKFPSPVHKNDGTPL